MNLQVLITTIGYMDFLKAKKKKVGIFSMPVYRASSRTLLEFSGSSQALPFALDLMTLGWTLWTLHFLSKCFASILPTGTKTDVQVRLMGGLKVTL